MKNNYQLLTPLAFTLILVAFFFLRNQNPNYQLHKLMKEGEIRNKQDFKDSIDFFYENNLIYLKVQIEGREGIFLFDTGSPTAVSSSFIQKLGLRKTADLALKNEKGEDIATAFYNANFKIQNTVFKQIILKEVPEKTSEEVIHNTKERTNAESKIIDGIIGANLMQHCLWQIDPTKQKIYFSNRWSLLPKHPTQYVVSFTRDIYRCPRIYLTINDFPKRPTATVSTGNAESIILSKFYNTARLSMNFARQELALAQTTAEDSVWQGQTKKLAIANLTTNGNKILFTNSSACYLGNEFLKNYLLTIDWANRKMYLQK